jgi:hypothetical protein
MRNEVHVALNENVVRLFSVFPPATLGLEPQFAVYKPFYDVEVSLLDLIRKSEITGEIDTQDHVRDHIVSGFCGSVKSNLNHFDPVKQAAARKLNVVIDNYGNIAAKTLDQETAAIDDLNRELASGDYPALVNVLLLDDWVKQLFTENQRFKTLMAERYTEVAQRPTACMKVARKDTDKSLRGIFYQIEALALVNGVAAYDAFIKELNAVLNRFKHILAQEHGQKATPKQEESV